MPRLSKSDLRGIQRLVEQYPDANLRKLTDATAMLLLARSEAVKRVAFAKICKLIKWED